MTTRSRKQNKEISAEILEAAVEVIDVRGWTNGPQERDGRVCVLGALARAAHRVVGEDRRIFDHIEDAISVLEAMLDLEAAGLLEWNNRQSSAEQVTDALRLASLEIAFSA